MLHGLLQALRDRERDERAPPDDIHDIPAERTFKDDGSQFAMMMRRKRVEGVLKHMLSDAGYGDLAKMSSIRRQKED